MPVDSIIERIHREKGIGEVLGLFFDFDGTISEIVSIPDHATILPGAKESLIDMVASESIVAGVISGRGIDDLKKRVGVSGLIYSGNHGAELDMFGEEQCLMDESPEEVMGGVASVLQKLSAEVPGLVVENKKFSVTIHTRNVKDDLVDTVKARVMETSRKFEDLAVREGKRVFEILSPFSGNKGNVLDLIIRKWEEKFHLSVFPVYFGDDVTDRYVYDFLRRTGRGIFVFVRGNDSVHLEADFSLEGPSEVVRFMEKFMEGMNRGGTD